MRKEVRVVAMGALAFDLGTFVVPAQAETIWIKLESFSWGNEYIKFDRIDAAEINKCVAAKGTLVEVKGDKYCRTAKAGTSTTQPSTAVPSTTGPSNQRK